MNREETLKNLSNVTKAYLRISRIKTALTLFLVGYTSYKIINSLKNADTGYK